MWRQKMPPETSYKNITLRNCRSLAKRLTIPICIVKLIHFRKSLVVYATVRTDRAAALVARSMPVKDSAVTVRFAKNSAIRLRQSTACGGSQMSICTTRLSLDLRFELPLCSQKCRAQSRRAAEFIFGEGSINESFSMKPVFVIMNLLDFELCVSAALRAAYWWCRSV